MERFVKFTLYGDYVFEGPVAEGSIIFDKLVKVKSCGYGRDATYVPSDEETVDFDLIRADQFSRSEEDTVAFLKRELALAEKNASDYNSARYNAVNELKELKKEVEILRAACPKPMETSPWEP